MSVRGRWNAYPGQSVTIELMIEGERVNVFGAVAWSAPDGDEFAWGVRFTAVHARCRRFIEAYVGAKLEGQRRAPLPSAEAPDVEPSRLPTSEMVLDSAPDDERMPTIDAAISAAELHDEAAPDDDGLLEFEDMPTLVFSRRSKELKAKGVVRRRKPRASPRPGAEPSAPPSRPVAATASPFAPAMPAPSMGAPSPVVSGSTVPIHIDPRTGMPSQAWDDGPSAFTPGAPAPATVDVSGFNVPLPPALDEPASGTEVSDHIPLSPAPAMPAAPPRASDPCSKSRTWPVLPPQPVGPTAPSSAPHVPVPEAARSPKMAATMILDPVADSGLPPDAGPPRDPNEPFDLQAQRRRRIEEILSQGKRRARASEDEQTPTQKTPQRNARAAKQPEPEPEARPKPEPLSRQPSAPQQPVDFSAEVRALYEAALRQLD